MKLELVKLRVEKKYIWGVRAVMFLAATPFLCDIYDTITTGVARSGRMIGIYGDENNLFYAILFKEIVFAALFLWFSTGGVVEQPKGSESDES